MQSESNYIKIILLYSIFCIIGIFFIFFLSQWQKPKFHEEKVLKEISCARVLKTWDPQDPGFLPAGKEALKYGKAGARCERRCQESFLAVCTCHFPRCQVCRQEKEPLPSKSSREEVSAVSDGIKLEGRSNFLPTLQTEQSARTDSTMGPLKPESDNGRGGGTIQLKTKADSSQNSIPEALQTKGKNKRVKIDSTLIHGNCTTGIRGISEVEIIQRQSFKS